MKLNQLIAVLQSVKQNSAKAITEIYHLTQKPALFQGLQRTYTARDAEGYIYPPESQKVTTKATDLIEQFVLGISEFYDLAYTQDTANAIAKADVKIDGITILAEVPVPHLLFLEKQLNDVKTFIQKLPVLAIDKDWKYDIARGFYATEPKETVKTKKITDFVVAYEATTEHPAQIKEVTKDVVEGTWSLVEFSSALPSDRVRELLKRVDKLLKAVVQAREEANSRTITEVKSSEAIFGYLFAE
jgi:hypothetical protein